MRRKHKRTPNKGCFYCLVEKDVKIRNMDVKFLRSFLVNGYYIYPTAEDAENGRQRGDAYDEPGMTRVVGFSVSAFLPKRPKSVKKG